MSNWESYRATMIAPPSLWAAARANDVPELAQLLREGADIDARDHRGYSALMYAAYLGHREAFEMLLASGANPNTADDAGNTVLMGAAFKGHLAMVRQLLLAGARVHAQNAAGIDAITIATQFGRTEVVALLQERIAS